MLNGKFYLEGAYIKLCWLSSKCSEGFVSGLLATYINGVFTWVWRPHKVFMNYEDLRKDEAGSSRFWPIIVTYEWVYSYETVMLLPLYTI